MLRKGKKSITTEESQVRPEGSKQSPEPARKKKGRKRRFAANLFLSLWLPLIALAVCAVSYSAARRPLNQLSEDVALQLATEKQAALKTAIDTAEASVVNWSQVLRGQWYSTLDDVLLAVEQGGQMLNCRQLYAVDEYGYFYGSGGGVSRQQAYLDALNHMGTDQQVFCHRKDDGSVLLLVCLRIKPFTVEEQAFVGVVAELLPGQIWNALTEQSGNLTLCVLDEEGVPIAQTKGTDLLRLLEKADITGYASFAALKKDILEGGSLELTCTSEGTKQFLITQPLEGRGWIFAALCPADTVVPQSNQVISAFLRLGALVCAGALVLFVQQLRLGIQRGRAVSARQEVTELRQELEQLQESAQSHRAFTEQISDDVRTPLNSVLGFATLAARHVQEPDRVNAYLEKLVESAGELLTKMEYGLGTKDLVYERTALSTTVDKPVDLAGRRVLVVEDNQLNREITEEILKEAGMLVECAGDGQEAFQCITTSKPGYYDLVLMDIHMPVMDGYEATKIIRRLRSKFLAEIPILAMTADVAKEDKQKAFQAGMDGYVEKPFRIQQLLRAMQLVLAQRER